MRLGGASESEGEFQGGSSQHFLLSQRLEGSSHCLDSAFIWSLVEKAH